MIEKNRIDLKLLVKHRGFDKELLRFDDSHLGLSNVTSLYENLGFGEELLSYQRSQSEELFKDNRKRLHLRSLGFVKNDKLDFPEFKLNLHGYRSDEFKKEQGIITLGCSDTYGSFQRLETTWPYKLAKHFGVKLFNLAIPGAGLETNYLSLKNHIKLFKKGLKVFWLIPGATRMNVYSKDVVSRINPWLIDELKNREGLAHYTLEDLNHVENFYYKYFTSAPNLIKHFSVHIDAIKNLCRENNHELYYMVNPIHYDNSVEYIRWLNKKKINGYIDRGCDLMHMGTNFQQDMYEKFLNKTKEKVVTL